VINLSSISGIAARASIHVGYNASKAPCG